MKDNESLRRIRNLTGSYKRKNQNRRILNHEPLEDRRLLAVVISEFMASNETSLVDEDGEHSDWIEVRNTGPTSQDLNGWYLTDKATNPAKWEFPAVTLPSGGHLVVFASEKNRRDSPGPLHANFKLSNDGEYLGLIRPDGTTVEFAYAPTYPGQSNDISFGLSTDLATRGYFANATPGQLNTQSPISDPSRDVVISEIMYSLPLEDLLDAENFGEEFIELHNRGTQSANLNGWKFTRGVEYAFPNVTIAPNGYLVVAADRNAFLAKYPVVTSVVGGWTGQLSNSGETIELVDAASNLVDNVHYASEGDWGVRTPGPIDSGHRGWIWAPDHDGGGPSLELVNRLMSNDYGQNWKASTNNNGTPGAQNSVRAADAAPLILDVIHSPAIPHSNESVTVTARLIDEGTNATARLRYRADGASSFMNVAMNDTGTGADKVAGDGLFSAVIPPFADRAVVEFYVEGSDGAGNSRTWPAPTRSGTQVTNALYQVVNEFDEDAAWAPGSVPIYFQIMTAAERTEFTDINRQSDAQFNTTFISLDGTGVEVRYNAGVRIRGSASRNNPIPNNRINFPNDRPWRGVSHINMNASSPSNQIAGAALFRLAGIETADARPARMFSNGVDLRNGVYTHLEVLDSDYAVTHYPHDPDGNIYRGRRSNESPCTGEPNCGDAGLDYLGPDPFPYLSYVKYTNSSRADWSDVIQLTDVLENAPDATFVQDVSRVANVDQWLRSLAMNQLVGNDEFGLFTGDDRGDDYAMYRGVVDPRFQLLPYDLDSLFADVNQNINQPLNVPPLNRLISHPEIRYRYYAQYLDLIDNLILTPRANETIDLALIGIASNTRIAEIKQYLSARAANVKNRIPEILTVESDTTAAGPYQKTGNQTVSFSGHAPEASTVSMTINNSPVDSLTANRDWSHRTGNMSPGLNRFVIRVWDAKSGTGNVVTEQTIDVWYDDGNTTTVTANIAANTTWSPAAGPYVINREITVDGGATLTIQPGTSVFFGTQGRLVVNGRLMAVGAADNQIRITHNPGTRNNWLGIQFRNSATDNRIEHAILEYGVPANNDGMIGLEASQLNVDHVLFDHADLRRIRSRDSSLVVRNSNFSTIFPPGTQPSTNNLNEHIWGGGIPANGQFLIENNIFGHITGHNDSIDFDSGTLPNPIAIVRNNVFMGGGDDAMDMTGDVWIEGNTFKNFIKDQFNTDPGQSNTISASGGNYWMIRNVFDNVQHSSLVKEGAFAKYLNNTVTNASFAPLYFDLPGQTDGPGRGAFVENSIFAVQQPAFDEVLPTTDLTVRYSFLPQVDASSIVGDGNLFGDPHVGGSVDDYALLTGSRGQGTARHGQDMGARIPAGAIVSGEPPLFTNSRVANLIVGGPAITHYRYRLDNGAFSAERPISQPIQLQGLADGPHTAYVIGKNEIGIWQPESEPNASRTWTISGQSVPKVQISEILANNVSALDVGGQFPDLIELYNPGANAVNLSGFALSDSPNAPGKFVFPSNTILDAGQRLPLVADDRSGIGTRLGFQLNNSGEGLFLFDNSPTRQVVDFVTFGNQLPDLSISRLGYTGEWGLSRPTFGQANVPEPVADSTQIKINEWYSAGDIRVEKDYLELFNSAPKPVNLGGHFLTDKPYAIPKLSAIAPLSFVSGQGFATFIADGDANDGANHVSFRLSPDLEQMAFVNPSGNLVDVIFSYEQTNNVSQGRTPDASGQFGFIDLPSPGTSNGSTEFIDFGFSWDEEWRYDEAGVDRGTAWREPGFNDSAWSLGAGPIGNENEPLAVPIATEIELGDPTVYFRKKYTLPEGISIADVQASISTEVDDGFIVWLNGRELVRRGVGNGDVGYADLANRNVNEAAIEGPFTVPTEFLVPGENVFAVEVHQIMLNSTDLVFGLALNARVPIAQSIPTTQLAESLRVTELMYHSADSAPHDYIEIQNISNQNISLAGVRLSGAVDFAFPNVIVRPNDRVVVAENAEAFLRHYGQGANLVGEFAGQLADSGERIELLLPSPYETAILRFDYSDAWYPSTDGQGFSLEIVDPSTRFDYWGRPESWRASATVGGTPGYAPGQSPFAPSIVINEVLSHTDPPVLDAIEIYNRSTGLIAVSAWYLTDSQEVPAKFKIPAGTLMLPRSYRVYDETQFNSSQGVSPNDFALNSYRGERLWLWATDANGGLARIIDTVEFGAAANGEAIGRYPNADGELYPLVSVTLGSANSGPRVGPVVISEINYHPADPSAAALAIDPNINDDDLEFIEIHNPTPSGIDLTNWRIRGGVDYDFSGSTLPAGQSLIVVSFQPTDPANRNRLNAFRANYGINDQVRIVGPYIGKLDNGGNQVRLQRPDEPPLEEPTFVPHLLEDEVTYDDDGAWPASADGQGNSLTRQFPAGFGNDAKSWHAAAPTPGRVSGTAVPGDLNGDMIVNEKDINLLCQSMRDGSPADLNGDGATNKSDLYYLVETILGTDIGDANLDGAFNSRDFVNVFQAGEYEDRILGNSTWGEGDWNCDGDFSTGDLIEAFQRGGYSSAAVADRQQDQAVAEFTIDANPVSTARHHDRLKSEMDEGHDRRQRPIQLVDARLSDRIFANFTTMKSLKRGIDDNVLYVT